MTDPAHVHADLAACTCARTRAPGTPGPWGDSTRPGALIRAREAHNVLISVNAVCGHCGFVSGAVEQPDTVPFTVDGVIWQCPDCTRTVAIVVKPAHDADTN